jgi:hypothetical protein
MELAGLEPATSSIRSRASKREGAPLKATFGVAAYSCGRSKWLFSNA